MAAKPFASSADPTNNTKPNQHDYDELVIIYNHSDGALVAADGSISSEMDVDDEDASTWGTATSFDKKGRPVTYERELGGGKKKLTHVLWAE